MIVNLGERTLQMRLYSSFSASSFLTHNSLKYTIEFDFFSNKIKKEMDQEVNMSIKKSTRVIQ